LNPVVDTLGHLPALNVTPANEDDRKQSQKLARQVQGARDQDAVSGHVDQG
jgi:hypothetical protein